MSFPMQIPHLCAKCGENPPIQLRTIEEERVSINPWTLITMFIGVGVTNRRTITYGVPLCVECSARIAAREKLCNRIIAAGGFLFLAAILLLFSQTNVLETLPVFSSLRERFNSNARDLTVIGLFISSLIIIFGTAYVGKPRFASTNGETFRFYNKEFQKAFAELNPDLVKRSFWKRKRSPSNSDF